jgi:hypothetical protein
MRYVYENLDKEKARVKDASKQTIEKFTWRRAAETILSLPIPSANPRIPKKRKVLYIIPYNVVF